MKEEWRRQMQRKMADYEEPDIKLSWSEIDKALETNRQKVMTSAKAKTIPLWFRRIAAAAVILLLAGVGFWKLQHHYSPKDASLTMDAGNASLTSPHLQGNTPPHLQPQTISKTTIAQTVAVSQGDGSFVTSADVTKEPSPCDTSESTDEPEDKATPTPQPRPTVIYPYEIRHKASSQSRLTARVYFSNATTGYSNILSTTQQISVPSNQISEDPNNPSTPHVNPQTPSDGSDNSGENTQSGESVGGSDNNSENQSSGDESGNNQQGNNTRQGGTQQYRTQQTNETTRHYQPVRFGISLRYRISDRWSIESGLTYTRLAADFTKTVDDKSVTTEQHLNYIGIPVTASYLLWGSRYVNIYLSAGAMVEKMVSGSRTSAGVTNSVSIHPLQFSVSGAAGAEFRFSPQLSLYAEPGLGYWFDNGSDIPTYYQDKPLSFSLSLGLRLNLWDNN